MTVLELRDVSKTYPGEPPVEAVLAVPITALNALPGGGYEVIVIDGATIRRVRIETGLFDETAGVAEVSGQGLTEGQQVQVPRDEA